MVPMKWALRTVKNLFMVLTFVQPVGDRGLAIVVCPLLAHVATD